MNPTHQLTRECVDLPQTSSALTDSLLAGLENTAFRHERQPDWTVQHSLGRLAGLIPDAVVSLAELSLLPRNSSGEVADESSHMVPPRLWMKRIFLRRLDMLESAVHHDCGFSGEERVYTKDAINSFKRAAYNAAKGDSTATDQNLREGITALARGIRIAA